MRTKIISKTYVHISLDEAKDQLRLNRTYTEEDPYLTGVIQAATDMAANYIENTIALTSLETIIPSFSGTEIVVEQGNFQALDSITYTDRSGTETILSAGTGYRVEAEAFTFKIILEQHIDAKNLTLSYQCGFTAATIEPVIRQAILIKITDLFDVERSSYTSGSFQLNKAFESLLNYHKRINIL